jgi:uncharacterized protein (TIGR03067 family)
LAAGVKNPKPNDISIPEITNRSNREDSDAALILLDCRGILGWNGRCLRSTALKESLMRVIGGVLLTLVATSAFFGLGCGSKPKGPPVGSNLAPKVIADELATLTGTWVYERQVVEGREIPIADKRKDSIIISGNSLVRTVFQADGKSLPPLKSRISVDPTASPKQMDDDLDVGFRISRRLGIYKLKEDRLTLCYDNTGKQRPTTFDSPAGTSLVLTVLRRQGK